MKLVFVKLHSLQQTKSGSTDELRPEIHGELTFYPEAQIIRFGEDEFVPMNQVKRMKADNEQVICPECAEGFVDNRGLGAHRSHVHGVAGKSRGVK